MLMQVLIQLKLVQTLLIQTPWTHLLANHLLLTLQQRSVEQIVLLVFRIILSFMLLLDVLLSLFQEMLFLRQ